MDQQAANLLATLKRPAAPSEAKVNLLNTLKSDIKHYRVPETAQATIFDCLKLAITQQASSTLASSAFSTLGHLIKRLKIQDASGIAIKQLAPRLFPALQDRLGDLRESVRSSASQALTDLYPVLGGEVEEIVREEAIGGSNPRAKEVGMQWVVRMHKDESMQFKGYVSSIVARLEDSDGNVREAAKTAIIELFRDAPDRAKTDLKRQLKAHSVRLSIEAQILAQIGAPSARAPAAHAPESDSDLAASVTSRPLGDHAAPLGDSVNREAAQSPPQEIVQMDPLYVHSQRELEDTFREMLPHFEGRESEGNWMLRDKSVLRLRRLLKGNAATEFHLSFMAGVKSVSEGILKVANSLRTTMSSNGCHLVQELARTLGPAMDPHVEIFLQSFVKMSANTKHIAAENGRLTSDAIFQNCTYHARMLQHIWSAAQEKNAQTRQCTPEWLRTILKRQAGYKQHFESSGGLELAEKCIRKGLDDANPKVKEGMRATYWTFARSWPDKADAIASKLDPKSKTALERDPNNPNAALHSSHTNAAAPTLRPGGSASRAALREMMAEQRKAKATGKLPDRPNSAMAQLSPMKGRSEGNLRNASRTPSNLSHPHSQKLEQRVVSTASTSSGTPSEASAAQGKRSALMSGPVRRPRKPEIQRPQTADPYASRRMLRPETPASNGSPMNSPSKGTDNSKAAVPASSAIRDRAQMTEDSSGSPAGSPVKRSAIPGHGHAEPGRNSRPSSKRSNATQEEDFTMVMPTSRSATASGQSGFIPGHKRPGQGQTMSVDSGIPAMAGDEGFTMVIPDLPDEQVRARSPLAYRSPLKAMFDEARDRLEQSGSPPRRQPQRNGIDETIESNPARRDSPMKAATPAAPDVQIYEDPFIAGKPDTLANGERKVLGELPVNETRSQETNSSPVGSPRNASEVAASQNAPGTQEGAEAVLNRRLLVSGIEKIRTKTVDAFNLRNMQDLAKSPADIWEGGKKYDDLMGALLDYLQTFDQDARLARLAGPKAAGLKAQALGLVRALLTVRRKFAVAWHGKALVAVVTLRGGVEASSHVLMALEGTADDVLRHAAPDACLSALLDFLPAAGAPAASARSVAMALKLTHRLLDAAKQAQVTLGPEWKVRLTQTAARYLDDADAEVRQADMELACDLFGLFGSSKAEFWHEFRGTDEGRLGLLTYYIARRGKASAAAAAAAARP